MGNIVLLDDLTINKIAAGEVIERPASVVKEMVENSIDAGAKNITVEISNGGISLIKITDDGCGIAEDDMEIAFERHATSKIRKAEDLTTVTTMGFRGEALASIASIAKVEMVSKREKDNTAHRIIVEGGKILDFSEAARSVGTTITVTNLFYNTPVRYKFLKKDFTEAGYIEDVITRIALVNKDIAIKLINKGKTVIQTTGNGDMKTVIYSIYGKDIATETINIDYTYEDIKVEGMIGKPVTARGNRSNQLFFLNGRYIKDKNLTAAADQSFKGMIPVGRYGFIVLDLKMDPKYADVNVHPAKLEVRFTDESKIFKAVYHAIKSGLTESELVENVENNSSTSAKEELEKIMQLNRNSFSQENSSNVSTTATEKSIPTSNIDINNNDDDTNFENRDNKIKTGLFSKILKKQDDLIEETNNNYLEDIFKYRQKIKGNDSLDIEENEDVSAQLNDVKLNTEKKEDIDITKNKIEETVKAEETKIDVKEELEKLKASTKANIMNMDYLEAGFEDIQKAFSDMFLNSNETQSSKEITTDNDDCKKLNEKLIDSTASNDIKPQTVNFTELNKEVKLNDTIISSNTREIDVDNVNKLIKETIGNINNNTLSETQKVDLNSEIIKNNNLSSTQVLNTEEIRNNIEQNTTIIPKEKINMIPEHTQVLNAEDTSDIRNSSTSPTTAVIDIRSGKKDAVVDNNGNNNSGNVDIVANGFAAMAEKMVESKLDIDSTQMIDTLKIREAIKNKIISENDGKVNPEFDLMYSKTFGVETVAQRREREAREAEKNKLNAANDFSYPQENLTVFDDDSKETAPIPYKFLGIAFSTYIIIELKDEMYIIDQHAAHERIMYEKVKENYYSEEEKNEQFLLLPDVISLSHKEMMVARENEEMFNKAGFTFEEFGENTIKLLSVPSMCEDMNTKQLFLDILDEIDTVAVTARQEKEDKFIATIACKSAVKAKMKLDEKEVDSLIMKLLELQNPFTCPHGRPTAIKMTKTDLERKFSRR